MAISSLDNISRMKTRLLGIWRSNQYLEIAWQIVRAGNEIMVAQARPIPKLKCLIQREDHFIGIAAICRRHGPSHQPIQGAMWLQYLDRRRTTRQKSCWKRARAVVRGVGNRVHRYVERKLKAVAIPRLPNTIR